MTTVQGKLLAKVINDIEPEYWLIKRKGGKEYQDLLEEIRDHLTYEAFDMLYDIVKY